MVFFLLCGGWGLLGGAPVAAALTKFTTAFGINAADLIHAAINDALTPAVGAAIVIVKIVIFLWLPAHPRTHEMGSAISVSLMILALLDRGQ